MAMFKQSQRRWKAYLKPMEDVSSILISRDRRFFHCEYYGPLKGYQKKHADKRTYDDLVYYGRP